MPTLDESKFAPEFRNHPRYPTLKAEIERSPTLVNEINNFPGKVVLGGPNSGGTYLRGNPRENDRITIEGSWLTTYTQTPEATGRFATMLGHELGHAQRPGGYQQSNAASSPNEATRLGLKGEGVAITAEYIVARELNRPMWSDSNGSLKTGMDALATQHGLNTPAFNQAAETLGGNTYGALSPSNSPNITYREYYAYNWAAAKGLSNADYRNINWSQVQGPSSGHPSITYSTNPAGTIERITGSLPQRGSTDMKSFDATVNLLNGQVTHMPATPVVGINELSADKQAFLQQTRDAMNRLCDEKGYPNNQGRENMICALALTGLEKNMPGVDAAFVKDNNVSIFHNPQGLLSQHVTMDSTLAANQPAQQSLEKMAELNTQTQQQELQQTQQTQQTQQQQMERQAASHGAR